MADDHIRVEISGDSKDLQAAAAEAVVAMKAVGAQAQRSEKLWRDQQGRLRKTNGRFATDADKLAAGLSDVERQIKKTDTSLFRLSKTAKITGAALLGLGPAATV